MYEVDPGSACQTIARGSITLKNATHSLRRTIKEETPTGALQKNTKDLMHANTTEGKMTSTQENTMDVLTYLLPEFHRKGWGCTPKSQ